MPVLLPHSGELASLLDCREEKVERDPVGCGRRAAELYRSLVLVKGVISHVVTPDGDVWTYDGGAPGLGVSGSGDVLAGIVGGLLARGAEPLSALLWAVWLHGEAGAALAKRSVRSASSPAKSRTKFRRYFRAEASVAWCRSSSSPISRTTWSTLVDPAVPNGIPAISTMRSPPLAN